MKFWRKILTNASTACWSCSTSTSARLRFCARICFLGFVGRVRPVTTADAIAPGSILGLWRFKLACWRGYQTCLELLDLLRKIVSTPKKKFDRSASATSRPWQWCGEICGWGKTILPRLGKADNLHEGPPNYCLSHRPITIVVSSQSSGTEEQTYMIEDGRR
jgi:hypothetical protein